MSVIAKLKESYKVAASTTTARLIYWAVIFSALLAAFQMELRYSTYIMVALFYGAQGLYRVNHPTSGASKLIGKFGLISFAIIAVAVISTNVLMDTKTALLLTSIFFWLMVQKRVIQLLLMLPIKKEKTPKWIKVPFQIVMLIVSYMTGAFFMMPIALWLLSTEMDFSNKKHLSNQKPLSLKERIKVNIRSFVAGYLEGQNNYGDYRNEDYSSLDEEYSNESVSPSMRHAFYSRNINH
ncbi:hypothetical protein FJM67_09400 [Maribrevibacterium harenarium]|uniref:Uncharacterized protein n=1 Tax=Maribrevibacterium harenarium TaxID=2589817 RepID=A0A501WP80_9GAMM|nr:hypothetical protein [Maribrevibacterium harenarium]TPE51249.1 hypothetical protein FJM67_09400 [Maribrevibacterium harenarium]